MGINKVIDLSGGVNGGRKNDTAAVPPEIDMRTDLAILIVADFYAWRGFVVFVDAAVRPPGDHFESGWEIESARFEVFDRGAAFCSIHVNHHDP
jgi:hypothetical protein